MPTYRSEIITATLASTPYHFVTKQNFSKKTKTRRQTKKEMKSQPKHPWCKKVEAKSLKKAHAEKDVKSKWAVKASCS